jgi:hypothetical protein
MVELIALVEELGDFRTTDETMAKPTRNEQLPLVGSRKHYAHPAAKGFGTNPDIDRDLKDLGAQDAA